MSQSIAQITDTSIVGNPYIERELVEFVFDGLGPRLNCLTGDSHRYNLHVREMLNQILALILHAPVADDRTACVIEFNIVCDRLRVHIGVERARGGSVGQKDLARCLAVLF